MILYKPSPQEITTVHVLLGHILGAELLKTLLSQLDSSKDNLERFARLLQAGLDPLTAKNVMYLLGYQTRDDYSSPHHGDS